jgi:threonine dehydratase
LPSHGTPLVFAGHGTIGLELAEQLPDMSAVVFPIGAGGMIAGIATALAEVAPDVRIIGVEPEAGNDTFLSVQAGERIEIDTPDTICDAVRTQMPGELTFPIVQALVESVVTVTDDEVRAAMRTLDSEGIVVEPTGALAIAAAQKLGLGPKTVCILSGGNISPEAHRDLVGPTP